MRLGARASGLGTNFIPSGVSLGGRYFDDTGKIEQIGSFGEHCSMLFDPEHDLVAFDDAESVADFFGDGDLTFRRDPRCGIHCWSLLLL